MRLLHVRAPVEREPIGGTPRIEAHMHAALKDPDRGKLGCAIWAYYKAGGERKPLDWKPGAWAP